MITILYLHFSSSWLRFRLSCDCSRWLHHIFISQAWLSLLAVSSSVVNISLLTAVSLVSGCQCCHDDGWCVAIILWLPDIASLPVCWQLYSIYLLLLWISTLSIYCCSWYLVLSQQCAATPTIVLRGELLVRGLGPVQILTFLSQHLCKKSVSGRMNEWVHQL